MRSGNKETFKIAGNPIKEGGRVFIIAEAGVNHNQDLKLALKLVDIAADCGADAVKFQTFKAAQVVTESGEMAAYQKKNTGKVQSQRQMLKQFELPEDFYHPIINRCKKRDILFMSTPHGGKQSVGFLESLGVAAYKIGSGDLTNYILLDRVAKTGKPIILSSGMATMTEVKHAVGFVKSRGNHKIAMLHSTTNYPCPPEEVNLRAMQTMMDELDFPIGYSDHTEGNQVAIMAATIGIAVYECHFTTNKSLPGPDHIASAEPDELREKIQAIRNVPIIFGSSKKAPNSSERKSMLTLVRRSIVVTSDLEKNHTITADDLEAKRPGDGVSPINYENFIGRKLKKSLKADSQLTTKDLLP